ncbi:MAG TPA: hypothetical protein VJR24_11110 [Gemmatimonadaceae bacterium]|nr:hypothetical protein [Gemmatimonadaceae bacterium]
MSTRRFWLVSSAVIALALVATVSTSSHAQGRGHQDKIPPGQAKKMVSMDHATDVTREVLVNHGYKVVRVDEVNGTRVVYFRRGSRGHGHGLGPIERLVIRPDRERVVFDEAPKNVLVDINVKLGF